MPFEPFIMNVLYKILNFENFNLMELAFSLILTITAACIIGYRLKINRGKFILTACIFVGVSSSLYTLFFYQDTGHFWADVGVVLLPMILLVGIIGTLLIFRDDTELLDLRMLVVVWCIWGSAFVGTLAALQMNLFYIITLLLILSIKIYLHHYYDRFYR